MARTEIDYLIVGQGLAGTLLAHFLLAENQRIQVLDQPMPGATSTIAAGIVNPVTGRRIAKSWRFEELYHFAKETYTELEKLLGLTIWTDRNMVRALHNTFEENEWDRRGAFPEYEPFMAGGKVNLESFDGKIKPAHGWGEMNRCAQVALPELVHAYRYRLQGLGCYMEEKFDYAHISFQSGRVSYQQVSAFKIIFCEGARATANPYFNYLPFVPTKGELLIIKIPGARFDRILKHHLFIVPLPDSPGENDRLYWAGSTSRFDFEDEEPSEEQRNILVEKLEKTLRAPFEIVKHCAGIRPTVYDIRPFLGLHPQHEQLAIFNGLGTKGASLAPFFAKQMVEFLLGKGQLEDEVDIRRFSKNKG